MNYRISPEADADLDAIYSYIARDNPRAAARVERELHAEMQRLAEFPGLGHPRPDVTDPRYRFWKLYSYLIVYRIEGEDLIVVRVVHGARNLRGMR